MNIAVTGASGFIGRHVLRALLEQGFTNIFAVTREKSRLDEFKKQVTIVEMDIGKFESDCIDKIGRPDLLIHLAWDGLPNYQFASHYEIELPRQYEFLKNLVVSGLKKMFVSGTCFEYGLLSGALSECTIPAPDNPYGFAKDALRRQLTFLSRSNPFVLIWGRLFYLYGKGQSKNSLYSQLMSALDRKDEVFNMSPGDQLRDFISVTEASRVIVTLATMEIKNSDIINICSGKPISVKNIVQKWLAENNKVINLNLGYYPYPEYESMSFWGDNTKLQQLLELKYECKN
jgi:dTDP-6-deoxy-L-talose 4-dehydrogenase (NAD+)